MRKSLSISLPGSFVKELEAFQREEHMNRSELIREALRQFIALKKCERLQKRISARAQALGVRTERDVERIVHESRGVKS